MYFKHEWRKSQEFKVLSTCEAQAAIALTNFADKNLECTVSEKTLSNYMHNSEKTIRKGIKLLELKNHLSIEKKNGCTKRYTLLFDKTMLTPVNETGVYYRGKPSQHNIDTFISSDANPGKLAPTTPVNCNPGTPVNETGVYGFRDKDINNNSTTANNSSTKNIVIGVKDSKVEEAVEKIIPFSKRAKSLSFGLAIDLDWISDLKRQRIATL